MKSLIYKSTIYQLRGEHAVAISQPEYRFDFREIGGQSRFMRFMESQSPNVVDTLPAARFVIDHSTCTIQLQEPLLTKEEREAAIVEILRSLNR